MNNEKQPISQTRVRVIILAAGQGTRMKSPLPKVLHPIGHLPIIYHVLKVAMQLSSDITVVVDKSDGEVARSIGEFSHNIAIVEQRERLGTGHAVQQAWSTTKEGEIILILYGDVPFVEKSTLASLVEAIQPRLPLAVLGFEAENPTGYGRLILREGGLIAIREEKDASLEEKRITFCNSGIIAMKQSVFTPLLGQLKNANAQNEFYLTDLVALAHDHNHRIATSNCEEAEVMGINSQSDLAMANLQFQQRMRKYWMRQGVLLEDPATVYFSFDTKLAPGVRIEPHVYFGKDVEIHAGVLIKAFSHLEGARVERNCTIGPFARLRPGTHLASNVKIGNFVEVKNTTAAEEVKINHLSYVGDAHIGANCNIGAGTIFCNYDGYLKHQTNIGSDVFVGSNSALVAPLHIGDNALIGSGSVITEDVPPNAMAFGRSRQTIKPGKGAEKKLELANAKRRK